MTTCGTLCFGALYEDFWYISSHRCPNPKTRVLTPLGSLLLAWVLHSGANARPGILALVYTSTQREVSCWLYENRGVGTLLAYPLQGGYTRAPPMREGIGSPVHPCYMGTWHLTTYLWTRVYGVEVLVGLVLSAVSTRH